MSPIADNDLAATDHDDERIVVLAPEAASAVSRMGGRMGGISAHEVLRRGLVLLDLFLSLGDKEELMVHDGAAGRYERLRFDWDG